MCTCDTCTTHLDFSGIGMLLHFCLKPDFWKPLSCSIARLIVFRKRTLFSSSSRDPVISCGVCVCFVLGFFLLLFLDGVLSPCYTARTVWSCDCGSWMDWTKMNCVVGKQQHFPQWDDEFFFYILLEAVKRQTLLTIYIYIERERERWWSRGVCEISFYIPFYFLPPYTFQHSMH